MTHPSARLPQPAEAGGLPVIETNPIGKGSPNIGRVISCSPDN